MKKCVAIAPIITNTCQCLLSWIRQFQEDHPNTTVTCPQCKTPYELERPPSLALRALSQVGRAFRNLVPIGASMAMAGGVWIASTAYGCLALRLFLGEQAAKRTLAAPWPWHVRNMHNCEANDSFGSTYRYFQLC